MLKNSQTEEITLPFPPTLADFFHFKGIQSRGNGAWRVAYYQHQIEMGADPMALMLQSQLHASQSMHQNIDALKKAIFQTGTQALFKEALESPSAYQKACAHLESQLSMAIGNWEPPTDPLYRGWSKKLSDEDIKKQSDEIFKTLVNKLQNAKAFDRFDDFIFYGHLRSFNASHWPNTTAFMSYRQKHLSALFSFHFIKTLGVQSRHFTHEAFQSTLVMQTILSRSGAVAKHTAACFPSSELFNDQLGMGLALVLREDSEDLNLFLTADIRLRQQQIPTSSGSTPLPTNSQAHLEYSSTSNATSTPDLASARLAGINMLLNSCTPPKPGHQAVWDSFCKVMEASSPHWREKLVKEAHIANQLLPTVMLLGHDWLKTHPHCHDLFSAQTWDTIWSAHARGGRNKNIVTRQFFLSSYAPPSLAHEKQALTLLSEKQLATLEFKVLNQATSSFVESVPDDTDTLSEERPSPTKKRRL